jgi:8-oxo-dGTP pyrophosphatase MutT (NUDIX family)
VGTIVTIGALRQALRRSEPLRESDAIHGPAAAVAAVLREAPAGPELLFILRAEHPSDPWSGDMGWPGGRVDPGDGGPLATALRETREEVAIDLESDGDLIGSLPPVRTHLSAGEGPLWVAPFVFELTGAPQLVPNYEVQEAAWVPLAFLADAANRERFTWIGRGGPIELPRVRYEGRTIWGLTLRMLDDLLAAVGAGDPPD